MDKYTAEFLREKRQEWKKLFTSFIEASNNVNNAVEGLLDKHIYYSKSPIQIKHKIRRIFKTIERQLESMPSTRKDLDAKTKERAKDIFLNMNKDSSGKKILAKLEIVNFVEPASWSNCIPQGKSSN